MRTTRHRVHVAAALAALAAGLVLVSGGVEATQGGAKKKGDADGKNDRQGVARWEWKVLNEKGETVHTGTFTGHVNGQITFGKNQQPIGTFKSTGPKTIAAAVTKGQLQGDLTLEMTERKPLTYKGDLVRSDKTRAKVVVVIIND